MANDGDPNFHKFVQTFFLAEQPNGYFVLNDVFRFLKEETVDSDEEQEVNVQEAQQPPAKATQNNEPVATAEPPAPLGEPEPTPVTAPAPTSAPLVVEDPPAPATTVTAAAVTPAIPEPVVAPSPSPSPSPAPAPAPAPNPEPQSQPNGIHQPAPADPKPPAEPPQIEKPAPQPTPPSPPPPSAPPPATPAAAATRKTWADLAAQNPKKWGAAVAQESRGTTEVPVAASSSVAPAGTQTSSAQHGPNAARGSGAGSGGQREYPAVVATQALTTAQVFAKVRSPPNS
jgi:hypothetical protein